MQGAVGVGTIDMTAAAGQQHDVNRRLREEILSLRQAVIAAQLKCASSNCNLMPVLQCFADIKIGISQQAAVLLGKATSALIKLMGCRWFRACRCLARLPHAVSAFHPFGMLWSHPAVRLPCRSQKMELKLERSTAAHRQELQARDAQRRSLTRQVRGSASG